MSEHTSITALKSAEELAQELSVEQKRNASLQQLVTGAEQEITALRQERDRLLAESAASYSHGVEDMRLAAMRAANGAPGTPYTPIEAIRDVALTPTTSSRTVNNETSSCGCDKPAPAPRDSDLTQAVRTLVKRYGAPVIAAEAARQAKHH